MMARLEMGEVLLTTRMSNVFLRFRQPMLAWNTPLAESRKSDGPGNSRHQRPGDAISSKISDLLKIAAGEGEMN
jgi:hypothetical protein